MSTGPDSCDVGWSTGTPCGDVVCPRSFESTGYGVVSVIGFGGRGRDTIRAVVIGLRRVGTRDTVGSRGVGTRDIIGSRGVGTRDIVGVVGTIGVSTVA